MLGYPMKLETGIYVDAIDATHYNYDYGNMFRVMYPFVDALETNVDDRVDLPPDSRVDMCIYRINRAQSSTPFLQFLLYLDGNENDKGGAKLIFPYILSKHTKTGLADQCAAPLRALFSSSENEPLSDVVKYMGYIYHKNKKRCTIFFVWLHDEPADVSDIPFMQSTNRWWWALSSEIFNEHQMMNYTISESVIEFFNRNMGVMQLEVDGKPLESPSAFYSGNHFNYVSYMAAFGMKKASTRAHFGPYYYSVEFMSTMRYACYAMGLEARVLDDGTMLTVNEHGKYTRGGIVRFAVFLGRCRAFFLNGEEDRSDLSMYWAQKDPLIMSKLALRDINGDWTRHFDSAYVGDYVFTYKNEVKKRASGWTIKDYDHQIPLSCHEIDMSNIPDEFDPAFVEYTLI
jgi:hypothetical protein